MKIVYVGISTEEWKMVAKPFGDAMGRAFVEYLFGPMIDDLTKPKKKVSR